ncbi:MAG: hypothetical protein KBT33_04665 [Prevotellaceae bacterium]|nr:hypothetical protein [Candidatus Minthosoma equi]
MKRELSPEIAAISAFIFLAVVLIYGIPYIQTDRPKCDGKEYTLIYRTHFPDGELRTDTVHNVCECVVMSSSFGTNHIKYYTHKETDWLFSTHDKHAVNSTAALEIVSVEKEK